MLLDAWGNSFNILIRVCAPSDVCVCDLHMTNPFEMVIHHVHERLGRQNTAVIWWYVSYINMSKAADLADRGKRVHPFLEVLRRYRCLKRLKLLKLNRLWRVSHSPTCLKLYIHNVIPMNMVKQCTIYLYRPTGLYYRETRSTTVNYICRAKANSSNCLLEKPKQ